MASVTKPQFTRNKWIYSLSGIGRDMSYTLFSQFLLTYVLFTREVTVQQFSVIGILMTVCRIWDGINDPIMGGIIENTRTRFGKFKPYIFIGAITNAVVLFLIFANRLQGWKFVVFFGAMYLLWDITYTMNDIGYWSMLPSLTSQARERDKLTSMANLFSGFGTVLAVALIPTFTAGTHAIGGNSITAYMVVSAIIAIFFVSCQLVCCGGVREPHKATQPMEEHIGFRAMLKVIAHNDQLLWITLIMLLVNLGGALLTAFGTNYLYLEFGYNGLNVTIFAAFYAVSAGLINFIYPRLSVHHTRKQLTLCAIVATVAGYGSFLVTGAVMSGRAKFWVLCVEALVIGFGYALFYLIVTISLTNTIEYNEYKTGSRDEAIIFSLRPFMAKMSSALQQVILTVVYLAIGMTALTNSIADVEQNANLGLIDETAKAAQIEGLLAGAPPRMKMLLRICMCLIPVIFMSVGYFLMKSKNKIDEGEYNRMVEEIAQRKEPKNETADTTE